ncbi:MAG: DUF4331 domain-containing protein [Candidatus Eremiobacteraeota bacterium]|nr:DUF4331 domain-containing protein [Candidatus Eremiobacteraeota bacterium]
MKTRLYGTLAVTVAFVGAIGLYALNPVRASDHQDSPATLARPGADITDPYIFPSPRNVNNVVIVMDVHPLIPPGQGLSTYFDPGVVYQMNFDTKSENKMSTPSKNIVRDKVIQFTFGSPGANQQVSVRGLAPAPTTTTETTLVPVSGTGTINAPFTVGSMQIFAGARAEPFFFDLAQFLKILPNRNKGNPQGLPSCLPKILGGNDTCPQGFNNPGNDFLAPYDVLSMIVEMPRAMLQSSAGPKVAFWVSTHTSTGQ